MKILLRNIKTIAFVTALPLSATAALAASITGSIAFTGSLEIDQPITDSTEFLSFMEAKVAVGTQTGDYTGTGGSSVMFSPFSFNPFSASVEPLWWFSDEGIDYSFSLMSLTSVEKSPLGSGLHRLAVAGTGLASITGMDDTWGSFSITTTGNSDSVNHGFGAFSFVPRTAVPDGVSTVTLLGFGVLLLAFARRRGGLSPAR